MALAKPLVQPPTFHDWFNHRLKSESQSILQLICSTGFLTQKKFSAFEVISLGNEFLMAWSWTIDATMDILGHLFIQILLRFTSAKSFIEASGPKVNGSVSLGPSPFIL